MKRRILSVVCVAVLLGGLAACTGDKAQGSDAARGGKSALDSYLQNGRYSTDGDGKVRSGTEKDGLAGNLRQKAKEAERDLMDKGKEALEEGDRAMHRAVQ